MRTPLVILAALLASSAASAADYKPVTCKVRETYRGPALHESIRPPENLADLVDAPLDAAVVQRLEAAFDTALKATGAPAMSVAVSVPGVGSWHRSTAPAATPLLYWASAGKTFTGVVVLQLVQEGKLSLDDDVSKYVRDFPNGSVATIRDLLTHTSGLFSANEDLKARADLRYRTPAESLAISRKHGAMFCPGALWRYSNTGLDTAGEIVRQIDGRPLDEAIRKRIIEPLKLESMVAIPARRSPTNVAPLSSQKEKPIDPSWPGAAGPIAATAEDMNRFWAALLGGKLLPRATVESMFATLYPGFEPTTFYGMSTMVLEVQDGPRHNVWLGHAGGTPGANALAFYSLGDGVFVSTAITGDSSAVAVSNLVLKAFAAGQ